MTFSDLLSSVVEWVKDLSPVRVVHSWEQGALIRAGDVRDGPLTSKNGLRGTGIHLCVPLLDDISIADASEEVIETTLQTCTTADGGTVSLQFVVRYRIVNLPLMLKTVYEVAGTVANMIEGAAGEITCGMETEEARTDLAQTVCSEVEGALQIRGIQLEEISLRTFVECRAYRLLTEGALGI